MLKKFLYLRQNHLSLPEFICCFERKLQYIGSSGNLAERIRANLLGGNRESHTLINKLCALKGWKANDAVSWLKYNSNIKLIATETEDDAKILEDVTIAIYHPHFNVPLRKLKKDDQEFIGKSSK